LVYIPTNSVSPDDVLRPAELMGGTSQYAHLHARWAASLA